MAVLRRRGSRLSCGQSRRVPGTGTIHSIRCEGEPLNADQRDLLRRIESFEVDDDGCALPFALRLARAHRWSVAYSERVVAEYKRFVFLCVTGSAPCCPSEDVDAAWHMHLTYSRSYWDRFCGTVLGRPLHHEPSRGSYEEARKHRAMYAATLAAYRGAFGTEPPPDIWPPVGDRFGAKARRRVVSTAENWIVPKKATWRTLQCTGVLVMAALVLPGCLGGLNPLALRGTDFLWFLVPAMAVAVVGGRLLRAALQRPGPRPDDENRVLTWDQAAYVAGGIPRLTMAAIARLVDSGAARLVWDRLERAEVDHARLAPIERAVWQELPVSMPRMRAARQAVSVEYRNEADRLRNEGLVLTKAQCFLSGFASIMPLALVVLLFGGARLLNASAAGKPTGYLLATLFIGSVVGGWICLRRLEGATIRGRAILDRARRNEDALTQDLGMKVGVLGTAALAGTSLALLHTWHQDDRLSSGGFSAEYSGDGGGGGGGDGGCGGGGCGGCGGD